MALTKRLVKGSPLTFAEGDANLDYLAALATNTGSFAITGSNTFIGDQIMSGSINFGNGTKLILNDGGTPGAIDLKSGPNGWAELQSNDSAQYVWVDDAGAYIGTNWNGAGHEWIFDRSGSLIVPGPIVFPNGTVISGSVSNYLEIVPGSSTSGIILWDSIKNNYLVVDDSGSYAQDLDVNGFLKSGNLIATGSLYGSASYAITASYIQNAISASYSITSSFASTSSYVTNAQTASYILNAISASYARSSSYALSSSYTLTASYYNTSNLATTGSNTFNGNQIITGSVLGNVSALSITSNTASLDLSIACFYTLQLVPGVNTYINPSNIKAGETVSLLLSTTGSATVSFPATVKQPSGSSYIPTTITAKDILTLISFDATNLYLVNVKNLI